MTAWYYSQNGQQLGPTDLLALQRLAAQRLLAATDLVWTEGMAQWQPAGQVGGIFATVSAPPSPRPAQGLSTQQASYSPVMPNYASTSLQPPLHQGLAVTAMVLSICGVLVFPLLAIPGIICGSMAIKAMKRSGDTRGRGFALAGIWIGAIYLALMVIFVGGLIAAFIAFGNR